MVDCAVFRSYDEESVLVDKIRTRFFFELLPAFQKVNVPRAEESATRITHGPVFFGKITFVAFPVMTKHAQ